MQPTKWTMGVWQQTPCGLRGPHAHQPPWRAWAATQTSQAFLPRPRLPATALGQPTQKQKLPELPSVISQKGQQGLNQPRSPRGIPASVPRGRPLSPGPPGLTQPICPEHWLEAASTQGFTQNSQTSREDIPRSCSPRDPREPPGEPLARLGTKPSAEKQGSCTGWATKTWPRSDGDPHLCSHQLPRNQQPFLHNAPGGPGSSHVPWTQELLK